MAPQLFQLVMRSGPTPGKIFSLDKAEITIGRDTTNDVVINDAEVSRKHARILLQSGGYVLEDLGSTNGTFIEGQRLMGPHPLRPSELIMLGENISLGFEPIQYDQNATVVASAQPGPTTREALPESFRPVAPPPSFSGQVPPGPVEELEMPAAVEPPRKSNTRTWLLAGCGCLLLILCCVVGGLVLIDQPWNTGGGLYCTPPFDVIFSLFVSCP